MNIQVIRKIFTEKQLNNSWRGFRYTLKGKKIGFSDSWKIYENFVQDMGYPEKSLKLSRIDKNKPFSKENCVWDTLEGLENSRRNNAKLEYEGKIQSLKNWAKELELTFFGIKIRYYQKYLKNLCTANEVLFGIQRKPKKQYLNAHELEFQALRNKASKMVSSYRCKDRKRRFTFDLTVEWVLENILFKPCNYCSSNMFIGCDRIDNKKGHTKDNVVPCCIVCNQVRNDNFTVEEMTLLGQTIKKINQNRILKTITLLT